MNNSLNKITANQIKMPKRKYNTITKSRDVKHDKIVKDKNVKIMNGKHRKLRFNYRITKEMSLLLDELSKKLGMNKNQVIDTALIDLMNKLGVHREVRLGVHEDTIN